MPASRPTSTDQGPSLRPTHSEQDSKGDFLGFEGRSGLIPASLAFAGVLVASIAITFKQTPIALTIFVSLIPAFLSAAIILLYVSHKPPGFLRDKLITASGGAMLTHRASLSKSPYHRPE